MKALGIAATGMLAQQTNVDVIANNIANANTTGWDRHWPWRASGGCHPAQRSRRVDPDRKPNGSRD